MSSAEDMIRWDEALAGDSILNAEAKEKLYAPHILEGEGASTSYGYGWSIASTESAGKLITHNGGNGVFFADFLRFVDSDLTIFIASNNDRDITGNEAYDLANIILETDEFADPGALCDVTQDELVEFAELEEFPDDAAGRAMSELFALFAEGDETAWREFAETGVLGNIAPVDVVVEEGQILQAEFGTFEVTQILQSEPQTYRVKIESDDAAEFVITADLTDEEPTVFSCLAVD